MEPMESVSLYKGKRACFLSLPDMRIQREGGCLQTRRELSPGTESLA